MALVFTIAGLIGLIVTIFAFNSKYYRQLSDAYLRGGDDGGTPTATAPA